MIKVLIVDDEKIVRLGLQALADWETFGFSLCHEASNGLQALEILRENPDIQIVLLDMQMPRMGGLQFLEEVNRLGLTVKVIVLSAHDQYDFIRRAFKLGVTDYIMKSEMNRDEILKQLQNAAAKLKQPGNGEPALAENDKLRLREKCVADLLQSMSTESHEKCMKVLGIDLPSYYFAAGCVLTENHLEVKDKLTLMRNLVKDIMPGKFFVELAVIAPDELGMLFIFRHKAMGSPDGELGAILRKFKSRLQNYMNLNVTIGVSGVSRKIEQAGELYKSARQNADMKFVLGQGKIIFPYNVKSIVSRDIGSISGQKRKMIDALREGRASDLTAELEQILETISQYNPVQIEKIFPYYMEIIFSIMRYLNDIGKEATDIFGRDVNFYEEVNKFKTREGLNNWVRNIVQWTLEHLNENEGEKLNRPVVMAREFIKKNYQDKSLSLRMVGDYVGLSENHLSSIFAKQAGKPFTEYVTELRVKKAETLLRETNLKVYEVAEHVGFANTEYFSRVFKKTTGKSPNQFLKGK